MVLQREVWNPLHTHTYQAYTGHKILVFPRHTLTNRHFRPSSIWKDPQSPMHSCYEYFYFQDVKGNTKVQEFLDWALKRWLSLGAHTALAEDLVWFPAATLGSCNPSSRDQTPSAGLCVLLCSNGQIHTRGAGGAGERRVGRCQGHKLGEWSKLRGPPQSYAECPASVWG